MQKTILIIDDERAIRNALREILEYEKYQVDDAEDGPSGIELVSRENYDVILCDIKMPKMDGIEVLENILKNICIYLYDQLFLLNTKNKALLVSAFLIRIFFEIIARMPTQEQLF